MYREEREKETHTGVFVFREFLYVWILTIERSFFI